MACGKWEIWYTGGWEVAFWFFHASPTEMWCWDGVLKQWVFPSHTPFRHYNCNSANFWWPCGTEMYCWVGWLAREWLVYLYVPSFTSCSDSFGCNACVYLFDYLSFSMPLFWSKKHAGHSWYSEQTCDSTQFFLLTSGSTDPTKTFFLYHLEPLQNNTQQDLEATLFFPFQNQR